MHNAQCARHSAESLTQSSPLSIEHSALCIVPLDHAFIERRHDRGRRPPRAQAVAGVDG
jgi:hypothetical protein